MHNAKNQIDTGHKILQSTQNNGRHVKVQKRTNGWRASRWGVCDQDSKYLWSIKSHSIQGNTTMKDQPHPSTRGSSLEGMCAY